VCSGHVTCHNMGEVDGLGYSDPPFVQCCIGVRGMEVELRRKPPKKRRVKRRLQAADRPRYDTEQLSEMLKTWNILNSNLVSLALEELEDLYKLEQEGKNRTFMKKRIHQRYSRLKYLTDQKLIDLDKKRKLN